MRRIAPSTLTPPQLRRRTFAVWCGRMRPHVGDLIDVAVFHLNVRIKRRLSASPDLEATVTAIDRSQAMIEFQLDGTIITCQQELPPTPWASAGRDRRPPHGMFVDARLRRQRRVQGLAGPAWGAANSSPTSSSGSARAARTSGSRGLQPDLRRRRQALQVDQVRHRHHPGRAGAHREREAPQGRGRAERRRLLAGRLSEAPGRRRPGRPGSPRPTRAASCRSRKTTTPPWTPCARRSARSWVSTDGLRARLGRDRRRPPTTCRAAPSSRPPAWKRPPPPWTRSPPRSAAAPPGPGDASTAASSARQDAARSGEVVRDACRRHGRDRAELGPDHPDHRGDRRDRLPDQPAGPERGRRSRPSGRRRSRASRWSLRRSAPWPSARPTPPRRSRP